MSLKDHCIFFAGRDLLIYDLHFNLYFYYIMHRDRAAAERGHTFGKGVTEEFQLNCIIPPEHFKCNCLISICD